MDREDNKGLSLHKLTLRHQASIISQLVDIGGERNKQQHIKFRSFIRSLQCLQPQGLWLRRTSVNAFCKQQYVALSYTWVPSEYKINLEARQYPVEAWDDNRFTPSEVRNCVFKQALSYTCHANVWLLWIKAHCIGQDMCNVDCRHTRCTQNRGALQAMDLVYQISKHPAALLSRPIQNESDPFLLRRLLSGDLVDDGPEFRLLRTTTIHNAKMLYGCSVKSPGKLVGPRLDFPGELPRRTANAAADPPQHPVARGTEAAPSNISQDTRGALHTICHFVH